MKLSHSLEDYMEAILLLEEKNRVARVKDIAEHLNVQMPSVTGALKTLREKNLVDYQKNSFITLTPEGLTLARQVQDKHNILQRFLSETLGLDPEAADDEACLLEHAVSGRTTLRLQGLVEYLSRGCPGEVPAEPAQWARRLDELTKED